MEEHRLKPMKEGYDEKLFSEFYKATEGLRRKLSSEIDYRRFGIEYEDMVSWFTVKFIYVFNKYYGTMPNERLKGFIINALKTYKNRVLRYAYQAKFVDNPLEFVDSYENVDLIDESANKDSEELLEHLYLFMKTHLTEDAFQVFDIQLNPPPFIVERLNKMGIEKLNKIPPVLIADYLNFGTSMSAQKYVLAIRQEIREALKAIKQSGIKV